jgi:hypothetical protein
MKPSVVALRLGSCLVIAVFLLLSWTHLLAWSCIMETPLSSSGRASAACGSATSWKYDAYVGYSIYCRNLAEVRRVRKALAENTDTRANVMTCTQFSDFLFLQPEKCMSMGSFDTWRWRHDIRDLAICLHKDAATAIEGLPLSMRPTTTRTRCTHYLPPGVGRGFGRHSTSSWIASA